jgi:CorA-like Mg2+ transporter protein
MSTASGVATYNPIDRVDPAGTPGLVHAFRIKGDGAAEELPPGFTFDPGLTRGSERLPPPLVFGIFGMNTHDLPFAETPLGTFWAIGLGLAAAAIVHWWLRRWRGIR